MIRFFALLLLLGWGAPSALATDPEPLALLQVAEGLALPSYATAPKGDTQRIFALELYSGLVRIVKNGQPLPTPFLDLSAQVLAHGERGLLCLAFHPSYASNRTFFVTYNEPGGDVVLARFVTDPTDPDRALPSGEVLLRIVHHYPEHNGGMIQFGPDGLLYFSSGDGGGPLDPQNEAQSLDSLLGKILRIDVNSGSPYGIPPGNPFVGVSGARPEIFCYGLRNPWRFCVDTSTGKLVIGDVGANSAEEIDVVPPGQAGQNFGWRCKEGTFCTNLPGCNCPHPAVVDPVFQYFHGPACAVIGGFVYRGKDLPGHKGSYFLADWCTGWVVSLRLQAGQAVEMVDHTPELLTPAGTPLSSISSFGLDGRGELLIVSVTGHVYRVVSQNDCDGDGISDAQELASGQAFDANLDGVPDDCQLLLTGSSQLTLGGIGHLWFVGAQPNQPVMFFGSVAGVGTGPCIFNDSVCLDLLPSNVSGTTHPFVVVASAAGDAQGACLLSLPIPSDLIGLPGLAFQAVKVDSVLPQKSNPLFIPLVQ